MKKQLIVLSLSPLFLLTTLQYFPIEKFGIVINNIFNLEMILKHLPCQVNNPHLLKMNAT